MRAPCEEGAAFRAASERRAERAQQREEADVKDVLFGVIGGVVGAVVWAGVAYFTEYEIGWIAWGIGGLVGYCVALANKERLRSPAQAGVIAVVITALSIAGGKYLAVELLVPSDDELVELFTQSFEDDEYVISYLADDVAAELEAAGRTVDWPEGVDPDNAATRAEYPADVWDEAVARWSGLSDAERTEFRETREAETRANVEANLPEIRAVMTRGGFAGSFTPMDVIFFGLGMVTAFSVASGRRSKEEIAAAYRGAMMLAMLRVMMADGRIDDDEVEMVTSVFKEQTGAELSADAVRAEAATIASGSTDLVATLEDLSPHLETDERETVVRSAIMVAMADGEIGPGEEQLIGQVASALDVSESHLRGILSRLAAE